MCGIAFVEIVKPAWRSRGTESGDGLSTQSTRCDSSAAVRAERTARFAIRRDALAASRTELLRLHRTRQIEDGALRVLEEELDIEELKLRPVVA